MGWRDGWDGEMGGIERWVGWRDGWDGEMGGMERWVGWRDGWDRERWDGMKEGERGSKVEARTIEVGLKKGLIRLV